MSKQAPRIEEDSTIPLARPSVSENARRHVQAVLNSSRLSRGPYLEKFEAAMAKRCGTRHAVAVSSGTAALHCIVSSLNLEPGTEVLTTPFSFVASTNVLLYENLKPVFVDVDPATYNIDVERLEGKITADTEAILAVDVFGTPANWPALTEIAEQHDLILIDDACEALGAQIEDRPIGNWGTAAAFGFYPNKQITTGEGGCITTDDDHVAEACRALRNHGRTGTKNMEHRRLGYNYRLDEMSAALGSAQLDELDTILDDRRKTAERYHEALASYQQDINLPSLDTYRSWFVYVVRLRDHFSEGARDELVNHLRDHGISCATYFPPIHLQPYHGAELGHERGDFPVCEKVASRTLALPFFRTLSSAAVERVSSAIEDGLSFL